MTFKKNVNMLISQNHRFHVQASSRKIITYTRTQVLQVN